MIKQLFPLCAMIFFFTQCTPSGAEGDSSHDSAPSETTSDVTNVKILKRELLPYGKNSGEPSTRVKTRFTVTDASADFYYIITLNDKQNTYADTVYLFADAGDTLTAEMIFLECAWDSLNPPRIEEKLVKNPQP